MNHTMWTRQVGSPRLLTRNKLVSSNRFFITLNCFAISIFNCVKFDMATCWVSAFLKLLNMILNLIYRTHLAQQVLKIKKCVCLSILLPGRKGLYLTNAYN